MLIHMFQTVKRAKFCLIAMFLAVIATACGRVPMTAYAVTNIDSAIPIMQELEKYQNSLFLEDRDGSAEISIVLGDVGADVLGSATVMKDGDYFKYRCIIQLHPEVITSKYEKYRHVLFHELGHCFGLDHSGDVGDIMYEYVDDNKLAGDQQIAKFNRLLSQVRGSE